MRRGGKGDMQTDSRLNLTPQFVIGMCLMLFGTLLMLDRLQIVDAAITLRLWPVVLIAVGTWIVVERGPSGRSFPGYAMIGLGSLLLLKSVGLVRVSLWDLFWPLFIVFIGARLVLQTSRPRRERHRAPSLDESAPGSTPRSSTNGGTISMFSALGGSKRTSNDKPFQGGDVTSIMGSTQLDLRQAAIEPGQEAVINVFAIMGGHDIWVPSGWTVVSEVMPILGSVEDKRLPAIDTTPRPPNEIAPRLVLRGIVMLGGLTIKN
jgi:predicted membrane protein